MNITPSEWENVTPYYFKSRLDGLRNKEMQIYRSEMERTRWLAAMILSPHAKKGTPIKPQNICVFSWEKTDPVNVVNFVTENKELFDKLRL
jgi:hypothetical protein